jgi:ribonuclease VapC
MSSVNWSEVVQKASHAGLDIGEEREELISSGFRIVSFEREDAETAAGLWAQAPYLSLADRACPALGRRLRLLVLTANRAWARLDIGVEVQVIR